MSVPGSTVTIVRLVNPDALNEAVALAEWKKCSHAGFRQAASPRQIG
jgi:hypothetical protein